jgi:hypothetical protein
MRFVGLVLVLISLGVGYYLGFRGLSFGQTRDRLAQLLNLPGLGTQGSSSSSDVAGDPLPSLATKALQGVTT